MTEEYLYLLREQGSGVVRYVGRSVNPRERYSKHYQGSPSGNRATLFLVGSGSHVVVKEAEYRWIHELRYAGAELWNVRGLDAIGIEWMIANRNRVCGPFAKHVLAG